MKHIQQHSGVLGSDLETGNNIIRINIPITLTGHSLESRFRLDRREEILSFDWIPGRATRARNDIFITYGFFYSAHTRNF